MAGHTRRGMALCQGGGWAPQLLLLVGATLAGSQRGFCPRTEIFCDAYPPTIGPLKAKVSAFRAKGLTYLPPFLGRENAGVDASRRRARRRGNLDSDVAHAYALLATPRTRCDPRVVV